MTEEKIIVEVKTGSIVCSILTIRSFLKIFLFNHKMYKPTNDVATLYIQLSSIARRPAVVVYNFCAIILSPDILPISMWTVSGINQLIISAKLVELQDPRHRKRLCCVYVQTWRKKGQHMQLFMRHESHWAAVINMLVSWQHPHGFIIPSSYSLSPITLSYWRGWVLQPQLFYMFPCSLMSG